jgi:hypothetical protein
MDYYYDPAKHSLTPVVEVDASSGAYEFDLFCIWQHDDGTYRWADDSGCSCPRCGTSATRSPVPLPFEYTELKFGTARDALIDLKAWALSDDMHAFGYYINDREGFWRDIQQRDDVRRLQQVAR